LLGGFPGLHVRNPDLPKPLAQFIASGSVEGGQDTKQRTDENRRIEVSSTGGNHEAAEFNFSMGVSFPAFGNKAGAEPGNLVLCSSEALFS
jgi:hypothetical protein